MDKKTIRQIINAVILFIFGLIDLILLVRLLLKFIGARTESAFVTFWYDFSDPLHAVFSGTISDLGSGSIRLELDTLFAMIIYLLIALLCLEFVRGLFKEPVSNTFRSLGNTGFKVLEGILALRLFFKLIGAGKSTFIAILYSISSPVYEPFKGLLPTIKGGSLEFETSTSIAILILIIFDIAWDKLFEVVTKDDDGDAAPKQQQPQPQQFTPSPQQPVPPAPQSSQTIPQSQQQPVATPLQPVYNQPQQYPPQQPQ